MRTIEDIDAQRKRARISKRELCRTAGIHVETYRRVIRKIVSPTLRTLDKLDGALLLLTREAAE